MSAQRAWAGACALTLVLSALGLSAASAGAKTTAPARWDPRVTKYVNFVERHRNLKFEHPVPVKFLADAAFVKAYQGDDPKITKQDRADAEREAGQLRALGLIEGPVDLIQASRDLDATDVVGFYDQHRKTLYVRGTDLSDVDVRVTLVHELTHALQDQHFNLTKLDDAVETAGDDFALTALVEGDATSVEDDYLFSLPQADQDAYFAEEPDDTVDASSPTDIPAVLDVFESGPYVFGSRYIEFLRDAGGRKRVDHAFADPPSTEEQIIDPVAARQARPAQHVATPKLAADEQRRGDADDFGALSLYLVLASRIDPQVALRAADGWRGDRYVGFTKKGGDGKECVRVAFAGDTTADTTELADALTKWAAALPTGAATSARDGDRVRLTACDTGATPAPSEDTLDAAMTLLVDRNDLALELLRGHVPPKGSRCAADQLAADPTVMTLYHQEEELTKSQQNQLTDLVTGAIANCPTR